MPYLSEGYSEATVDEDAVRKLTEFGDDYGSAIGQPMRLLEPPDDNNNKEDCLKSQKKFSKVKQFFFCFLIFDFYCFTILFENIFV